MLEYLKDIEEYDALFFMPHPDVDIHIQSNRYKNPGTPIDVGSIGPSWHVLLFRHNHCYCWFKRAVLQSRPRFRA